MPEIPQSPLLTLVSVANETSLSTLLKTHGPHCRYSWMQELFSGFISALCSWIDLLFVAGKPAASNHRHIHQLGNTGKRFSTRKVSGRSDWPSWSHISIPNQSSWPRRPDLYYQFTLEAGVKGANKKEGSQKAEGGVQDRQERWTAVLLHCTPLKSHLAHYGGAIESICEEWAITHSNLTIWLFYIKSSVTLHCL